MVDALPYIPERISNRSLFEARKLVGQDMGAKTYRMRLLLDLQLRPILELPLDNIGLGRRPLDLLGALERAPEGGERGQLDEVPHGRERSRDDLSTAKLAAF